MTMIKLDKLEKIQRRKNFIRILIKVAIFAILLAIHKILPGSWSLITAFIIAGWVIYLLQCEAVIKNKGI